MKNKVIDSIKYWAEMLLPPSDKMSAGDLQWHVNTLRENNRQLQEQLHNAQQQRTEALERLENAKDKLHAYEDINDELRTRLRVPAGKDILEYVRDVDVASVSDYIRIIAKLEELLEVNPSKIVPAVEDLQELATIEKDLRELDERKSQGTWEQKYKALVFEMASVRELIKAADNVGTVDQVRTVMGREATMQARERQLITNNHELSKKLSDMLDVISEREERWERKAQEWHAVIRSERETVASLLEDRRLLHEENKKILVLTGASSNETPVVAVERIMREARNTISWEREQRELERANNVVTEQMKKELSRAGG